MGRGKLAAEERERLLAELSKWISERLDVGEVPRAQDVVEYARSEERYNVLTQAAIKKMVKLHPSYAESYYQQRGRNLHKRQRAVTANALGFLHADIGFYSRSEDYETPKTFRSGYLVARDMLSRYIYAVPLRGAKSAQALLSAFETLFENHDKAFGTFGHRIHSISFDKERGVMSKAVQAFLKEKGVDFYAFSFSSSKAKGAENAIRYIRNTMRRLRERKSDKRWWVYLQATVNALNSRPVVVKGKNLGYAPKEVTLETVDDFLDRLYKKVPGVYWSQFEVDPQLVKFKFHVKSIVRPKLVAVSRAVLGEKRSEKALSSVRFVVEKQLAYVTSGSLVNPAYKCIREDNPKVVEVFDERELALAPDGNDAVQILQEESYSGALSETPSNQEAQLPPRRSLRHGR